MPDFVIADTYLKRSDEATFINNAGVASLVGSVVLPNWSQDEDPGSNNVSAACVHAAFLVLSAVIATSIPSASVIAERRRTPTAALAASILSARRAASAMPLE
jgi:hypothetical protein